MIVFLGILSFIILTFVQPQEFMSAMKGLPVVYINMALVGLIWAFQTSVSKKIKFGKGEQNILMFALFFIIIISTLSVGWLKYTFDIFIEWSKVIIIYFLITSIIDSEKRLKTIIWTIVLSMSVTAALGVLQYYGIDFTGLGTHLGGRIRGVGIFGTNQLAYGLIYCLPFIICLFLLSNFWGTKIFLAMIFSIYLYSLYLTQSRGGLICLVVTTLVTFFIYSRRKITKIGGIIFCIFLFIVLTNVAPRFSTVLDYRQDTSALWRMDLWGEALMGLKNNPIFGIGKGQFSELYRLAAHSSYIEAVTELGLIGLFIWLALFYYSLKNLNFIINKNNTSKKSPILIISKSLQISLLAYLIGSYFSSNAYYIPLYILIALSVVLQHLSGAFNKITFRLRDFINIVGIEFLVLLFIRFIAKSS